MLEALNKKKNKSNLIDGSPLKVVPLLSINYTHSSVRGIYKTVTLTVRKLLHILSDNSESVSCVCPLVSRLRSDTHKLANISKG